MWRDLFSHERMESFLISEKIGWKVNGTTPKENWKCEILMNIIYVAPYSYLEVARHVLQIQ